MLPDAETFNERLRNLTELGYAVAAAASADIEEEHGAPNAVVLIGAKEFVLFNKRYWALVSEFKKKNKFTDGGRINSPKKAALTIYAAATGKKIIFRTKFGLDYSHAEYALYLFALGAMKMFMGVDIDKIAIRHRRDLIVCLFKLIDEGRSSDRIGLHLLCLYMDTYWQQILAKGSGSAVGEGKYD